MFLIGIFLESLLFSSSIKPLEILPLKKKSYLVLSFIVQEGYGIQRKASNWIKIFREDKLVKTITRFRGKVAKEDPDYFSSLYPIKTPLLYKKGPYKIQAQFFYCSFQKKFCSIYRTEKNVP